MNYTFRASVSDTLLEIMDRFGLRQRDLADVLEVSLDRVKNLRSGRSAKLTQEEIAHLIKKLKIRALWLTAREGAMTEEDKDDDEDGEIKFSFGGTSLKNDLFPTEIPLSSEEEQLVLAFRAMPEPLRAAALRAVQAMAGMDGGGD